MTQINWDRLGGFRFLGVCIVIQGMAALFAAQLAGEFLATALRLPVPGAVIGMALLLACLHIHGSIPDGIGLAADGLLKNMAVLFVPAGVGVMLFSDLIEPFGLVMGIVLVAGTFVTFSVTGLTAQAVANFTLERFLARIRTIWRAAFNNPRVSRRLSITNSFSAFPPHQVTNERRSPVTETPDE